MDWKEEYKEKIRLQCFTRARARVRLSAHTKKLEKLHREISILDEKVIHDRSSIEKINLKISKMIAGLKLNGVEYVAPTDEQILSGIQKGNK